jgi:hypothetical protein
MGELAPFNSETVIGYSNDQSFDTRHGFAVFPHCRESHLNIGQQLGGQSARYPRSADADVADTTETLPSVTHCEPNKPVDFAPMSPTVFHASSVE